MNTWALSDTHFAHKNIMLYEQRPFRDVAEMEEVIIKNWNSVVKMNDVAFHLGDFGFYPKDIMAKLVGQLNGRITLIRGNHDTKSNKWYREVGFHEVVAYPIIAYKFLILSHEPVYLAKGTHFWNVHGHIHSNRSPTEKHINVSVEAVNYTPVKLDDIIKRAVAADFGDGFWEGATDDEPSDD